MKYKKYFREHEPSSDNFFVKNLRPKHFLLEKHDVFCTRQSLWVFLAAGIVQRKDRSKFMRMI